MCMRYTQFSHKQSKWICNIIEIVFHNTKSESDVHTDATRRKRWRSLGHHEDLELEIIRTIRCELAVQKSLLPPLVESFSFGGRVGFLLQEGEFRVSCCLPAGQELEVGAVLGDEGSQDLDIPDYFWVGRG